MIFPKRAVLLPLVIDVANRHNVPPILLDAIVAYESSYDQFAIKYESRYKYLSDPETWCVANKTSLEFETELQKTSFGLCQVMGGTARWLGHKKHLVRLFDAETNLAMGCAYINKIQRLFTKQDTIIASYNAGTPVLKDGVYKNQKYVDKVNSFIELFKSDHSVLANPLSIGLSIK